MARLREAISEGDLDALQRAVKGLGDGGFDMFAEITLPAGRILTLVECKKWAPNHPVSVEVVRNLYGVLGIANATHGLIATTSRFTRAAESLQDTVKYRISLRDGDGIAEWLRRYQQPPA